MKTPFAVLLLLLFAQLSRAAAPAPIGQERTVSAVVLPGPLLAPRPDPLNKAPVRLRVVAAYPHGTLGFRYDIAYFGMEAGSFDLSRFLVRADGAEPGPLPAVPVDFQAVLPPGQPGSLAIPSAPELPRFGGYRLLVGAGLVVWVAVLAWILNGLRKPSREVPATPAASPADRLRPLLLLAAEGRLDPSGRAEFERILLGFWAKRLGDSHLPVAQRLANLRSHPEAGPLLLLAETWLHAPPGRSDPDAEKRIAEALKPLVAG